MIGRYELIDVRIESNRVMTIKCHRNKHAIFPKIRMQISRKMYVCYECRLEQKVHWSSRHLVYKYQTQNRVVDTQI